MPVVLGGFEEMLVARVYVEIGQVTTVTVVVRVYLAEQCQYLDRNLARDMP